MNKALIVVTIVLACTALFMWSEVRSTWDLFTNVRLEMDRSHLNTVRRVEDMLVADENEEALRFVRDRGDFFVVDLDRTKKAISESSWRWPSFAEQIKRIDETLANEAKLRSGRTPYEGRSSDEAAEVLSKFKNGT